jgi:hypothetical protein
LDGADKGNDDKKGSTMLETKMLETKIENQPFAVAAGRIRPRSPSIIKAGKRKVGKREAENREGSNLYGTSLSIMALPSRPVKPCSAANDKDHSRLAMQAAKRMKSSKDKLRTGRLVCLHLRSLLTATQSSGSLPTRPGATQSIENRQYPLPI